MNNSLFSHLKKEVVEILDRHPTLSPDNAFVVWFLRAFIVENEDIAVQSLKGGSRDKGVDALFIDHETRAVFLIQGKYHQHANIPSERRSDVIALADLGRSLLTDSTELFKTLLKDADETVKQALEEARSAIRRRGYRLSLQFVTTGKVSSTHRAEAEQRIEDWQTAGFQTFSRADLLRLMQDYIEGAAPPTPTIILPIHGQEAFKRHDDSTGITSWIFTMAGSDVAKIFEDVGIRLFARNIRGYLGPNDINRGIQATLKDEPEYFWYFNNGITIVCDEARQIGKGGNDYLRVANAQIINGQQTTRSIALQRNNDAKILVKLVEIPRDSSDGHSKYSHIVSEIVSATNWQNAISQLDLKANDSEQVRMEREFRKLDYYYLRKRMTKSEARRASGGRYGWVVKKEDIARSVGACVLDPYEVRRGKHRLFEDDVYTKIFDNRPAAEYLTFYWLDRLASYWGRGDSRRGYARWVVLNFIWSRLGQYLCRPEMRERFRRAAERSGTYNWELQPLYRIADTTFSIALAFYRANKRRDGKLQDESTFFKHGNLDREFRKFWDRLPSRKRKLFERRQHTLFKRLESIEW
jgi:hypothetical protein